MSEETRRRTDSLLVVFRRFSRLWGFLAFTVFVVWLFRQIALPFVLAGFIAYLLAPLVAFLSLRMSRAMAVILIYICLGAILAGGVGFVLPALFQDLMRLRDAAPELVHRSQEEWLPRATGWVEANFGAVLKSQDTPTEGESPPQLRIVNDEHGGQVVDLTGVRLQVSETRAGSWMIESPPVDDSAGISELIRKTLFHRGQALTTAVGDAAQSLVRGVAFFMTRFLLTLMVAAFVLIDLKRVTRFIRSLVPPESRPAFDEILEGVNKGMAGVIRGQLIICLVNGVLTYIGLLIVGVKYSLLLGILASVFSLVPIFGTIISSLPIVGIALLSTEQGVAIGKAVAMVAWISGIHLVEANLLNPKIIGGTAHIHPVIVVFALLAGEHVYGLVGALLAVPVASMIQTVFLFARRNSSTFVNADTTSTSMMSEMVLRESDGLESGEDRQARASPPEA